MGILEDENVGIVETTYHALFRGDFDSMHGFLDDDIELESYGPTTIPFAGLYKGRPAVEKYFAIVTDALERAPAGPVPSIQEMIAQGDKVIVIGITYVRGKATGTYYDGWWINVVELRSGLIVRIRQYYDTASVSEMFQGVSRELMHAACQ